MRVHVTIARRAAVIFGWLGNLGSLLLDSRVCWLLVVSTHRILCMLSLIDKVSGRVGNVEVFVGQSRELRCIMWLCNIHWIVGTDYLLLILSPRVPLSRSVCCATVLIKDGISLPASIKGRKHITMCSIWCYIWNVILQVLLHYCCICALRQLTPFLYPALAKNASPNR